MIEEVINEMKTCFGADQKRIDHALQVAKYAEEILSDQDGCRTVVMLSAYLHDIGITEAEKKYQSSAPEYQEALGPDIARKILLKLNFSEPDINEVCHIIGHHHSPGEKETVNFKVLYDADMIVNLKAGDIADPDRTFIKSCIDEKMLTPYGKKLAMKVLL